MVRAMTTGAAKKATGAQDKTKTTVKTEMTEEMIKNRQEFELNEDPVSKLELWSWYGYDWANSVYSSVVIAMFLPLVMMYLAEDFACPYTYFPINYNGTEGGDSNAADWNGFLNGTTSCSVNSSQLMDQGESGSLKAAEFGGPEYGLDRWPVYMQVYYCQSDECYDQFYLDDVLYQEEDSAKISCEESTGLLDFGAIRNVTITAGACKEEKSDVARDCNMYKAGSNEDSQTDSWFEYGLHVENAEAWTGDLKNMKVTLVSSTNPNLVNATNDEAFSFQWFASEDEESTRVGDILMTIKPNTWAHGSTTLKVLVEDPVTGDEAFASFTVVSTFFVSCPFKVPYFGGMVRPITFASFTLSISVIGQAITFVSLAAFGDFGPFRKLLLCYSSLIGSVSCMAIMLCDEPSKYPISGYLTIISNIFFGASHVLYSAYLPYLSRSHPRFLDAKFEYKNIKTGAATGVGAASKKLLDAYHDTQDMISAEGFFWGYFSGSFCCFLSIGVVMMFPSMWGLRLIIFLMGLWWFVFAIPLFIFVKTRPGPPFPADIRASPLHAITFSWRRIIASGYSIRHLSETKKFVVAYFFFSDGYNTIASVAILFSKDTLGMTTLELTILAAIAPMFGAIGMKAYRTWQVKRNLDSKDMLIRALLVLTAIPIYGFFGYLRELGIWENCPIGLVQKSEMFYIGTIYGSTLGPVQSYARTFFTDLIPPGQEAEYFGVFEISDRGSSWMGPLICGTLYEVTGSMRHAMWYLLFVQIIGLYLVMKTDPIKGSDDCRRKEVMVRMAADRKSFGIEKSGAPPSARKMVGLKSKVTGQSSVMSSNSSMRSSTGSSVESEKSSFKVFNKNNKVAQDPGFGGATVVEQEDDTTAPAAGFSNQTVIEQEDEGGPSTEGSN